MEVQVQVQVQVQSTIQAGVTGRECAIVIRECSRFWVPSIPGLTIACSDQEQLVLHLAALCGRGASTLLLRVVCGVWCVR